MQRKKRKMLILIITLSVLSILLIVGGVCAFLYFNTDMLKSNQTLFEKYILQNVSITKEMVQRKPEEMLDILNRNKYTSNATINAKYTSGIGTSAESNNSTINSANVVINSQTDKSNQYDYKNIRLSYDTENLAELEYIQSQDLKGFRLKGIKQFTTINSEGLEKVAENIGIDPKQLETLWVMTQDINLEELLNFTEEEKKILQKTYMEILEKNTNKEAYGKYQESTISINNSQEVVNGYYIELTKEQYYSLLIKLLEKLSNDEIILGKIDNLENIAKQYGVESEKNFRETFQDYLQTNIENIKGKNIGNEKFKIVVYEQEGQTVRTTIETDEGSLTIDLYNEKKSIKIDKIDTTQRVQKRQIFTLNQNIESALKDVTLEYIDYENGVENQSFSVAIKNEMQNSDIKKNLELIYELEGNKIDVKSTEYIKVVNEFENPVQLNEENNIVINELSNEQTQNVINILKQNIEQQMNTVTEKIAAGDINSTLKGLGFIKEDVIKEQQPVEVTEVERNRFNSNLTLFIGEKMSADDAKRLMEMVQGNLKDARITKNEKDKLVEITLEIERSSTNQEKKEEVSKALEENKSQKYNITMSYDEETKLINKIFLKVNTDK